ATGAGDLHLTARAAGAIDTAAPLSTPVGWDLDGAPRSSQPDVGADEFSGIPFSLTVPAQIAAGQPVSVTWTADSSIATSSDWIGLFKSGTADLAPVDKVATAGLPSGTVSFTAEAAPGEYEVRYFNTSSQLRVAVRVITVVMPAPPASSPGAPQPPDRK